MLNELFILSQCLDRIGVEIADIHKDLKKNPKEYGFILSISDEGLVESLSFQGKEKMKEFWKIDSGENGVSFPGFKLSGPIWDLNSLSTDLIENIRQLDKVKLSQRKEVINRAVTEANLKWNNLKQDQKRYFTKNIKEFPEQIQAFLGEIPKEFSVLKDTLNNILKLSVSEDFFTSLSEAAQKLLCVSDSKDIVFSQLQNLLFGRWDSKNNLFIATKTAVILEAANGSSYQYPITHHKVENFINSQLNTKMIGKSFAKGGKSADVKAGIDSYSGKEEEIQTRFPDPNLPIIGITKLMSMTKESENQIKYGLKESETFPVGKNTSQEMLNALNFLTDKKREGKSWKGVPNSEENGKDLLMVYLEDKPKVEFNLADYFATDNENLKLEGEFEASAEKVCSALDGELAINPDSLLRLIVLTSRDKGRTQVSLNEVYQVKNIFDSAEQWIKAGENIPQISMPIKLSEEKQIKWISAKCPHPVNLLKTINIQWTNEGTINKWLSNCNLGQIYQVFLQNSERYKSIAQRLLNLALKSNNSLLLAAGNRLHGKMWNNFPDKTRLASLNSVSALGILLFKIGHFKENYMKNTPYNIGRLLSLADQLHALYCKEVRDGSLPPKLLGNAVMNTALQQPAKAMSLFAQRVLPYWAWADTVKAGENIGLAKYFLKEIGSVSQIINEKTVPTNLTDTERAEMILGYLAGNKRSENQN